MPSLKNTMLYLRLSLPRPDPDVPLSFSCQSVGSAPLKVTVAQCAAQPALGDQLGMACLQVHHLGGRHNQEPMVSHLRLTW
jgi:hypothetical protein